jgi:hypothetical protein
MKSVSNHLLNQTSASAQIYRVVYYKLHSDSREQVSNNVRYLLWWDQVFRRLSTQTITRMVREQISTQINENIIL